jgi:hypothetical protein
VGDRAVPAALVIAGICAGVGVLGITGAAVWAGIWGLGTPRDRAVATAASGELPLDASGAD